jgi:flavin-dependent dehydrogenase
MNLCLVCHPKYAAPFRQQASMRFGLPRDHQWHSVTPLTRTPIRSWRFGLMYIGDAGRVVEPFTGEGILYALRTGLFAGEAIVEGTADSSDPTLIYSHRFPQIYRNRLWVNQLARLSVLNPALSSVLLDALRLWPVPLKYLTEKTVRFR